MCLVHPHVVPTKTSAGANEVVHVGAIFALPSPLLSSFFFAGPGLWAGNFHDLRVEAAPIDFVCWFIEAMTGCDERRIHLCGPSGEAECCYLRCG